MTGSWWRLVLAAGLVSGTLCAQRAQLGIKGRTQERGRPRELDPIRRLPRRRPPPIEAVRAAPGPVREVPLEIPLSEDRLRPLVRRTRATAPPASLEPRVEAVLYPRPRKPTDPAALAAMLPSFVIPSGPTPETSVGSRWRLPMPPWRRYENTKLDTVYASGRWWDPFNRNTLKGDYPFAGRRSFFSLAASSDTLAETRRVPVASVASAARAGDFGFFGRGEQLLLRQSFRLSFDLFGGSAGFRPVDYEIRITPEFNINHLVTRENALVRVDVRQGVRRTDAHVGFQELFVEKRLFTASAAAFRRRRDPDDRGSAYFDFTSVRLGIQRFTSDFRGFVYSDEQPGVRLFGNFGNNVFQYNLAFFNLLEKDTNSGLNRWRDRRQSVWAANLYWTDFLTPGWNANFSLLYNNDQPGFHLDKNGFLVRPAPIGDPRPHKIRAGYAGFTSDGHIGRINVAHAFYYAFGRDDHHPVPAERSGQHIRAFLGALELAYERDWAIYKISFFMTTGDENLNDGRAKGFDGIVANQQFAGGGFLGNPALADRGLINNAFEGGGTNFLNRQAIPLTGTGVALFGPNSLMPSLRAGLFQGQANFINPGVVLFNAGMDAKLTPKLRSTVNVNYLRFHRTEALEAVLFQSRIRHGIGVDAGLGVQYRPLLSDNVVVTGGFGILAPQAGFKDIFTGRTLFSGFLLMRLLF